MSSAAIFVWRFKGLEIVIMFPIYAQAEIFSRSWIPSDVTLWNSLDISMEQLDSFASFCRSLEGKFEFLPGKAPDYFVKAIGNDLNHKPE